MVWHYPFLEEGVIWPSTVVRTASACWLCVYSFALMRRLVALPLARPQGHSVRFATTTSARPPKGPSFSREEGISSELGGFGHYAGSVTAFMRPASEKTQGSSASPLARSGGSLPCDDPASPAAVQAAKASRMVDMALAGPLPSPRRPPATLGVPPTGNDSGSRPSFATGAKGPVAPKKISLSPRTKSAKGLSDGAESPIASSVPAKDSGHHSSLPRGIPPTATAETSEAPAASSAAASAQEAEDYYRSVPRMELSKEEMWSRIVAANADKSEQTSTALDPSEADYLRMEEELKENDQFHYRMGEIGYPDLQMRRDYYSMWQLSMALNKARWTMLDVHSQRGVKTTGAGMKLLFWKESVSQVVEQRQMPSGQFTDSHPILRPFAATVKRNPQLTKAFIRGFTDARLKVVQQPGNVKQLFDHFDKFYGYFYNTLLELMHVKDEHAEHMLQHIGRATGLTQHCVMFWKKYAKVGFTMLPADMCADNRVNLALLKNIPLASRDRAVRQLLYDVMCIAKDEMLHAQQLASLCPPKAWPIVMECMYANYYLGFLQRRDFNVSAMFADFNIENAGFTWYRLKKRWEWERTLSIERLVADDAPLPLIGTSLSHRGSKYKMAVDMKGEPRRVM